MYQLFIQKNAELDEAGFERALYLIRKQVEKFAATSELITETFTFQVYRHEQLFLKECCYQSKLINIT